MYQNRHKLLNFEYGLTVTGCMLYLIVILAPLLVLIFQAMDADWKFLVQSVIPRGRPGMLFIKSLVLSVAVAVAGTALATATALWFNTCKHRFAEQLKWLFLFMLLIPSYIHTMAWGEVIHTLNGLFLSVGLPVMQIGGWVACGWVEVMYLLPLGVGLILLGLSAVDGRLIEAGLMMQPPQQVWKKIVIPLLLPFMALCAALLFLLTFIDYSIPSLFQVSTYALEIFAEFSYSNNPGRVLATAMPLLLVTSLVLVLSQQVIRQAVMQPRRNRNGNLGLLEWPPAYQWIQGVVIISIFLQVVVPLAVVFTQIGCLKVFWDAVLSSREEIRVSLQVAAAAAVMAVLLALPAAVYLLKCRREGIWLIGFSTLPLALPASLTGISLIAIFNHPGMEPFYNSFMMPVLASLIRFMPLALLVLAAFLSRINPLYFEAGRVLQRSPGQAFTRVFLPLALPGMMAAGVLVFAFTAGELGATLMVAPPGMATLTMKIYNYLHYGASVEVASLCLAMMILTAVLLGAAVLAVHKVSRRNLIFQEDSQP